MIFQDISRLCLAFPVHRLEDRTHSDNTNKLVFYYKLYATVFSYTGNYSVLKSEVLHICT